MLKLEKANWPIISDFYVYLLNSLTVEEHLWFYAKLKGAQSKCLSSEIDKMIADVDLVHKRKELSTNLSGRLFSFHFDKYFPCFLLS